MFNFELIFFDIVNHSSRTSLQLSWITNPFCERNIWLPKMKCILSKERESVTCWFSSDRYSLDIEEKQQVLRSLTSDRKSFLTKFREWNLVNWKLLSFSRTNFFLDRVFTKNWLLLFWITQKEAVKFNMYLHEKH